MSLLGRGQAEVAIERIEDYCGGRGERSSM